MAGEFLIQVFDIARFRSIRPVLDELDAGRALGLESRAILAPWQMRNVAISAPT